MEHVECLTLAVPEPVQKVAKKEQRFVNMGFVEQVRTKKQRKWTKAHAVLGQIGGNGMNHMEHVEFLNLSEVEHVLKVVKKEQRFVNMGFVEQARTKRQRRWTKAHAVLGQT